MNGSFLSFRVRQSTGSREHPGPRLPFRRLSLPLASFAPWVCHSGASLGPAIGGVCGTTGRLANASSGAPHGPVRPEATPEDRTQTRPPPPTRPGTSLGTEVPRDRQRFPSRDAGTVVGQTDHGPRKPGSVCDGDRAGTKGVRGGSARARIRPPAPRDGTEPATPRGAGRSSERAGRVRGAWRGLVPAAGAEGGTRAGGPAWPAKGLRAALYLPRKPGRLPGM